MKKQKTLSLRQTMELLAKLQKRNHFAKQLIEQYNTGFKKIMGGKLR